MEDSAEARSKIVKLHARMVIDRPTVGGNSTGCAYFGLIPDGRLRTLQ
jgi:hypothetical protein